MKTIFSRLRSPGAALAALFLSLGMVAAGAMGAAGVSASSGVGSVAIAPSIRPPDVVVAVGGWYRVDAVGGTFQPAEMLTHVEVALYDPELSLRAGGTPFAKSLSRSSGAWPDGPENEAGKLGYEVSPNVLGDSNGSLYGKPDYRSLRLFDGALSPGTVYAVEVQCDGDPYAVWIHPLRAEAFTMSRTILQSSEPSLTTPVYGPASVTRSPVPTRPPGFPTPVSIRRPPPGSRTTIRCRATVSVPVPTATATSVGSPVTRWGSKTKGRRRWSSRSS